MTKQELQDIVYKQGVKLAFQKVVIRGLTRDLEKKVCAVCQES